MLVALKLTFVFVIPTLAFAQASIVQEPKPPFLQKAIAKGMNGDLFDRIKANERARFLHLPPPFPMEKSTVIDFMKKRANGEDSRAIAYLGMEEVENYGNPRIREHGKELIKQAAGLGSTESQLAWAHIVWLDQKDSKEAGYWWNKAYEVIEKQAQEGDLDSMFKMGNYTRPPGATSDTQRAFSQDSTRAWLRKAAENGHIEAASMLGHVLDLTARTEAEQREGWKWMNAAAEAGDASSMVDLGRRYARPEKGKTKFTFVPYDPAKAWQWWDKAIARIGKQEVMELLEDLQESGQLPPRPTGLPPF